MTAMRSYSQCATFERMNFSISSWWLTTRSIRFLANSKLSRSGRISESTFSTTIEIGSWESW
jgi:hypothetical protein